MNFARWISDKLKGKDAAVGIAIASGRKKLAEITNLQFAPQPKLSSQFDKAKTQSLSAKDFILHLQNVDTTVLFVCVLLFVYVFGLTVFWLNFRKI